MLFAFILFSILILAGAVENLLLKRKLKTIPLRILVNGTRGKTSLVKMLTASLNAAGMKTYGRCTGSEASVINPDGSITPIVRKRSARISELIPFIFKASSNGAACLVVECMALGEENQKIFASKLLAPTHIALTNAYIDHVPEMGQTAEEVAYSLMLSAPKSAEVFASDPIFIEEGERFHLAKERDIDAIEAAIPLNRQNVALALSVCDALKIDEKAAISAWKNIVPDVGLIEVLSGENGASFYPRFSVNDYESMRANIEAHSKEGELCLIFNSRADREHRILLFEKAVNSSNANISSVYVLGDYKKKVRRHIEKRTGRSVLITDPETLKRTIDESDSEAVFLGLGNIKGEGKALIALFK